MMATDDEEYPIHLNNIHYADDSALNTLDICFPRPPPLGRNNDPSLWLIYIHGGAWRDPSITSTSFTTTQSHLLSSPLAPQITALASLNYRLSPYPSHPTDPSNPADPARNARHPAHITDVLRALLYLQETHPSSTRYILAGHSVGATLALQVAMRRFWGANYDAATLGLEMNVVPPLAIVGMEGIYDIPALLANHEDQPAYRDFVASAMDAKDWAPASPTHGRYAESWEDGRVVVLAHSAEDELVEGQQTELMRGVLEQQGFVGGRGGVGERTVLTVDLKGKHNEVWQTAEASRAIQVAIQALAPMRLSATIM